VVIDIWECVIERENESLPVCEQGAMQRFASHSDTCR